MQHLWCKLQVDAIEASFAARGIVARHSYSSSPPALTPPPHSTAPAPPSHDRTHNTSWIMAWGRSKAPKPDEATLISSLKDAVKDEPQDSSFPVDDACCKRYLRARATTT